MSRIPLKYRTNVLFYTKYTHPTLICRGTDACTHARTDGRSENIYSIFRDKLLLLGEHVQYSLIAVVCLSIGNIFMSKHTKMTACSGGIYPETHNSMRVQCGRNGNATLTGYHGPSAAGGVPLGTFMHVCGRYKDDFRHGGTYPIRGGPTGCMHILS